MPALLLMVLASSVFGYWVLPLGEHADQALSAIMALLWLSNFHFALQELDYFDTRAEHDLFLHTWSLSVEEQFYLLWPLLIAALLASNASHTAPRLKRVMLVLVVAGLAASTAATKFVEHLAFYMMPFRAWQFALGALVFLHFGWQAGPGSESQGNPVHSRPIRAATPWVGLALLLGPALYLTGKEPYPGLWAIAPSLGACLLILAGIKAPTSSVVRVLSSAPLNGIGAVSYAWYLWHWPVLVLGKAWMGRPTVAGMGFLVMLSLALAAISYRYFEKPIRSSRSFVARPVASLIAVGASLAIAVGLGVQWRSAAQRSLAEPAAFDQSGLNVALPTIYQDGCDDWYNSSALVPCEYGNRDSQRLVVLWGDSVGAQWFPALQDMAQESDWRLVVLTKSACPIVSLPYHYDRIGRRYTECEDWRRNALRWLEANCLATQFPWTRVPRICVSPPRVRRLASTLHRVASLRPASVLPPWPSLASAAA